MASEKTRTIKNAGYLYARTIITTLIGIYTSRIVIQTLGIDDYGIYGVTASAIAILSFINASMSGATSRFITFELGRGDKKRLHITFCTAMIIHIGIALVVLLLAETIGLWFLNNRMVIPADRMSAAGWVYQFSILTTMIAIIQVPYGACLIAHERFNVFAYLEMFAAFAKLGILYLVQISSFDHLIFYAFLIACISISQFLFARFYSISHFPEARFRWILKKNFFKPILSFSGWEMFGSFGRMMKLQGTNMLVNMFYGIAVNAAVGIGNTVSGAVNGLAYNIVAAFQPGITKKYAQQRIPEFEDAVVKAATYSFILYSIFAIPFILERNYILDLWLGNVPKYSADICGLNLLFNNWIMTVAVLNTTLKALGRNSWQNLNVGIIGLITILSVYITMKNGNSPVSVFLVYNAIIFINLACNLFLMNRYTTWRFTKRIIIESILRPFVLELLIFIALAFVCSVMNASFGRLCLICIMSIVLNISAVYGFILSSQEKGVVKAKMHRVAGCFKF